MVSTRSSNRRVARVQTRSSTRSSAPPMTRRRTTRSSSKSVTTISNKATSQNTKMAMARNETQKMTNEKKKKEEEENELIHTPMLPHETPLVGNDHLKVTSSPAAIVTDRMTAKISPSEESSENSVDTDMHIVPLIKEAGTSTSASASADETVDASKQQVNVPNRTRTCITTRQIQISTEGEQQHSTERHERLKYRKVSPSSSSDGGGDGGDDDGGLASRTSMDMDMDIDPTIDVSFDSAATTSTIASSTIRMEEEKKQAIKQAVVNVKKKVVPPKKSHALLEFEDLMVLSSDDENDTTTSTYNNNSNNNNKNQSRASENDDDDDDEDQDLYDPNDREHPENVWAKEARGYDSANAEEESDEYDSEESENEFKGWFYKGNKHSRGGKKKVTRRNVARKIRPVKKVEPLPKMTLEERLLALQNIATLKESDDPRKVLVYKFFQCALWDSGFLYTLMNHQFDAVFAVAGIDDEALMRMFDEFDDKDVDLLLELNKTGKMERKEICVHHVSFVETRGVLLADVMGLGKTIEGIAGAILRSVILKMKNCKMSKNKMTTDLPTLIIGPNDAVLDQWEDTLLMGGIPASRIQYFHPNDYLPKSDCFILMTRYNVQSELRAMFNTKESNFFPNLKVEVIRALDNQKKAADGKQKNKYRMKDETEAACVTRLIESNMMNSNNFLGFRFRTILIDEAHFLKNLSAYWGMGCALLGALSERSVPLTGTPYNNGPQDMATLMSFIDPSLSSAYEHWWRQATETQERSSIVKNVKEWRETYVVRREKNVLTCKLPKKTVTVQEVESYLSELTVYTHYETLFLEALSKFTKLCDQQSENLLKKLRQKELFTIMMSCLAAARMSLFHPLLPGGREYTSKFSPSRRKLVAGKLRKEISETCVLCQGNVTIAKEKRDEKANGNTQSNEGYPKVQNFGSSRIDSTSGEMDDADLDDEDFDGPVQERNKKKKKKMKECIPLPSNFSCDATDCGYTHYIHPECLEKLERDNIERCPRCDDMQKRIQVDSTNVYPSPYPTYCKAISPAPSISGFKATAKIQKLVDWVKKIPNEDKVIIYSFFKTSLDLIEGICVEDLDIECARFDGDVDVDTRKKQLNLFKTKDSCRVLLATVQSSGTGLNIVEANHIAFLDRWFNPTVHAQAEDRCHRLKQTKEVHVNYFDNSLTADQVMKFINDMKTNNSKILLADGLNIGCAQQSSIGYKDLTGIIGDVMRGVQAERALHASKTPGDPLPACNREFLVQTMEKAVESRAAIGVKKEEIDEKAIPEESCSSNFNAYMTQVKAECGEQKNIRKEVIENIKTIENIKKDKSSPHAELKKDHVKTEKSVKNTTTDAPIKRLTEKDSTKSTCHGGRPKMIELDFSDDDDDIPDAEFKK